MWVGLGGGEVGREVLELALEAGGLEVWRLAGPGAGRLVGGKKRERRECPGMGNGRAGAGVATIAAGCLPKADNGPVEPLRQQ